MYKGLQKRIDRIKDRLKNDFIKNEINNEICFINDFVKICLSDNNYSIYEKNILVYSESKNEVINNFNNCKYGYCMWAVSNRDYIKEIIIRNYLND